MYLQMWFPQISIMRYDEENRNHDQGNYGISVQWSDGHGTSIYPFDTMEQLFKEFK